MTGTESRTRTEKLAGDVADEILSGGFPPGMRLDEQMLAERFAVSRTPVREALRQLVATGLIEMRPRRGAVVASITADQLNELFVAMGEIEATCARLSALSMNPIERRRLQAQHDAMARMVRDNAHDDYVEANRNFHLAIYAGAHNPALQDFAVSLRRRLDPFRRAQFRMPDRLNQSHIEHERVVRAILAGDAALAHAAMLDHVNLVEDAFDQIAASQTRVAVQA
jgi:DNA-binding GntR family transcriptional regulator